MRFLRHLFSPPEPRYNEESVDKTIKKSMELDREIESLYETRTGHPIGDVVDRRLTSEQVDIRRREITNAHKW